MMRKPKVRIVRIVQGEKQTPIVFEDGGEPFPKRVKLENDLLLVFQKGRYCLGTKATVSMTTRSFVKKQSC
jgi:hypothetical protein